MKSFARFFLFGLVATSVPAVVCLLLFEIKLGISWHIAVTVAILCAQAAYFAIKYSRRARCGKSTSPAAQPRSLIDGAAIGFTAGAACIVYLFFTAVTHIGAVPSGAGPFDRAKMEGLVAQVRDLKFSGERKFYWSGVSGAIALSTADAVGPPNGWADGTEDKNLKVILWTNDGGHAPFAYGFAYSDMPLAPDGTPIDAPIFFSSGPNSVIAHSAASAFDMPGLHLMKRIDAHWWAVYDNSGE